MVRSLVCCLAVVCGLGGASPALAVELGGSAELQGRTFFKQADDRHSASLALRPTLFAEWNDRQTRLEAELFYRHDSLDDARSHGDVRSLYLQHFARDWDVLAGFARVNWGVTESRKLVDVVNQSDFVEDLASDDKLGQAMIALSWRTAPGTLDVYLLPYARARTFPGPRGQPRVGFDFAPEEARYESSAGQERVDLAARWRMRFGALDVNLSVFDGTARDPDILPCLRRGSPFEGTDARANCDLIAAVPPPQQPLPDVVFILLQGLGLDAPRMQRRPLHQVIVRHRHPVPLYAHCLTGIRRSEPRLTITSHPDGAHWLWYLGGQIATDGVTRSAAEQQQSRSGGHCCVRPGRRRGRRPEFRSRCPPAWHPVVQLPQFELRSAQTAYPPQVLPDDFVQPQLLRLPP